MEKGKDLFPSKTTHGIVQRIIEDKIWGFNQFVFSFFIFSISNSSSDILLRYPLTM